MNNFLVLYWCMLYINNTCSFPMKKTLPTPGFVDELSDTYLKHLEPSLPIHDLADQG